MKMHYRESQTVADFFISCLQLHDEEGEEWTNGQIIPALADSATKPCVTAPIHGTHYLRHPWDAC